MAVPFRPTTQSLLMSALFLSARLKRAYTWEPNPSVMGRPPPRRASTGKFSPSATSASASSPKRLSPRCTEMKRAASPCTRGDASGRSKLGTLGKMRFCAWASPGQNDSRATARQVHPILLDIASQPSDVAGADGGTSFGCAKD
jgi:hypothetical protein